MSESVRQKRSRNGCWTCKRRRRKCDETKPTCNICQRDGHLCEGYENRLRWNISVAARGRPARAPNSTRETNTIHFDDEQQEGTGYEQSKELPEIDMTQNHKTTANEDGSNKQYTVDTPGLEATPGGLRSMQKETLFQEFLTTGVLHLHATNADDSPLLPILPELCRRSDTLYDVCVACQAYLSYGANEIFYDFYSEALEKFRAHMLDHPLREADEAILNAALLMCTIGVAQGTPWTIHINGMQQLLDERAALSPLREVSVPFVQAIEVMGIFDMKVFVIGRQRSTLDAWRRYRHGLLVYPTETMDAVQSMSGLPYSLLDLLARYEDDLEEEDLWLWPGCEGTFLQCQMWDAYRFAVMLRLRHRPHTPALTSTPSSAGQREIRLPASNVLLTKTLSCIDSVYNGVGKLSTANSLVMNAILFPLFYVALEIISIENVHGRHEIIKQWYEILLEGYPFANTKQSWEIVMEYAIRSKNGETCDIEHIAKEKNIEVGLF